MRLGFVRRGARRLRLLGAVFLFGLLGLHSRPARSQTRQRARLVYSVGPEARNCPDEATLRAAVSSRLGYNPFEPDSPVAVVASVAPQNRALRASVGLVYDDGHQGPSRQISSGLNDCPELVRAVALAVSIALDALQTREPGPTLLQQPTAQTDPVATTAPIQPQTGPSESSVEQTHRNAVQSIPTVPGGHRSQNARRPWHSALGFRIVGSVGRVPGPSLETLLAGLITNGAFSLGLEFWTDWPAAAPYAGGQVHLWPLGASAVPCAWLNNVLGLCGVMTAGMMRAQGSGYATNRTVIAPLLSAGPRVMAAVAVTRGVSLQAHVDALVAIVTTRLDVSGHVVWSSPPLGGSAGLGVQIDFR